ncbi:uncharacterized protein V6R79_015479 [Siganus canaliculatus]
MRSRGDEESRRRGDEESRRRGDAGRYFDLCVAASPRASFPSPTKGRETSCDFLLGRSFRRRKKKRRQKKKIFTGRKEKERKSRGLGLDLAAEPRST